MTAAPQSSTKSLARSMKVLGVLLITLSNITPASSVFIIAPGVVAQAGTGAALSFIIAAFVGLFTAFVYAELSSAYPLTGGEYTIVGRVLGPFAGFIVLGLNFITCPLMVATLSLGIANYVQPILPNVSPLVIALITVLISTLFGILNLRFNAWVTGIFLLVELLVLAVLSYLGFTHIHNSFADFIMHPVYLDATKHISPAPFGLIGLATAVAIWAYNGYGQAVYFGEETHDAPKNIVRVIFLSLLITVIAEAVPIIAVLLGAPDLKSLFASQNMLTDFMTQLGGARLALIINLGVALAILNAIIAMMLLFARQFYSSGRDQVWSAPINRALTRLHSRFHSPWIATFVFGALSALACFLNQNLLMVTIGTSVVMIYIALCIAVIWGRVQGITRHASYKMPFYPLPPIAALIALFYVIYTNYLDEAVGRPSLWADLGMMALAAIYYVLVLRRRGKWELRAPI